MPYGYLSRKNKNIWKEWKIVTTYFIITEVYCKIFINVMYSNTYLLLLLHQFLLFIVNTKELIFIVFGLLLQEINTYITKWKNARSADNLSLLRFAADKY